MRLKGIKNTETSEQRTEAANSIQRSGRIEAEFQGSDSPKRPELKWFTHDDSIKRLIEMRCGDVNSIKTETLELSGSSSSTMSQKTACSIDAAISKIGGIKGHASMDEQATRERSSKLLFVVEF